jgi:hypothetical protein
MRFDQSIAVDQPEFLDTPKGWDEPLGGNWAQAVNQWNRQAMQQDPALKNAPNQETFEDMHIQDTRGQWWKFMPH